VKGHSSHCIGNRRFTKASPSWVHNPSAQSRGSKAGKRGLVEFKRSLSDGQSWPFNKRRYGPSIPVDRWQSFEHVARSGVRDFESTGTRITGRRSLEIPLKIGVGSWPWVILRVEPEERRPVSESWRACMWSSVVPIVSATLQGRKKLMKIEQVVKISAQSINGRHGRSGAVIPWYPCVQVPLQEPCRFDVPVKQEEPTHTNLEFNGSTTLLLSVASCSEYIYSIFMFL